MFKLILELANKILSQLPSFTQRKRKKFKERAKKYAENAAKYRDTDD